MIIHAFPPRFEALAAEYPGLALCRVVVQERGSYRIANADGERAAQVSGLFRFEAAAVSDYPAVGDYVTASFSGGEAAVIHHVLPRKSVFLRKAAGTAHAEQVVAANVDTAFICMSLNNDFNPRRLERYLSAVWDGGASPVVLLTKADLCAEPAALRAQAERVAPGVEIYALSARTDDNIPALLAPYLTAGRTASFVGSSGVGKSTLINSLLGEPLLKTNGLRNDDRGRHTTTRRALFTLPGGAMVIDTPGMRELGLWDADDGINAAFSDIDALAAGCRFRDCTHTGEPGCAVRAALARGELDEARLQSFLRLRTENAYALDAAGYLAAKEKKFREISRINKTNRKR